MLKLSISCAVVVLLFASASTQNLPSSTTTRAIVRTIHIDQPKPDAPRYIYVPFEVASSTKRINISYNYDRAYGLNTLDLGLFDPRFTGKAGDLSGFRGWSAYRRSEVFVSNEIATPGYIPGTIQPGTWRIIIGLYQVAPAGVDLTIKIDFETGETTTAKPAKAKATSQSKIGPTSSKLTLRWVRGDLHMHTVHSDGDWTIPQLITAAVSAGLDFIFITDHNTNSHHAEIDNVKTDRKDLLVMRGEEVTTYGGHANVWGLPKDGLIDFRIPPRDQAAISQTVDQAHRSGALISLNHPFGVCAGCMWSYGKEAEGFDAIEVWNGSWDKADDLAVDFWDRLLKQGRRITAIASSDSHRVENPLGQAATHLAIRGGLSQTNVLRSIREGRAYLTSKPDGPGVTFETRDSHSIGDVVRARNDQVINFKIGVSNLPSPATISLISDGRVVQTFRSNAEGSSQGIEVKVSHNTYFRIEVRDESGTMLVLTNPIYFQLQSTPEK
jgi:hypothetical protein